MAAVQAQDLEKEKEYKALAAKVINDVWGIKVTSEQVTPQLATYVFQVIAEAKEGHQVVKALSATLGPTTGWAGAVVKLANAVRNYMTEDQHWGLAIRAAVATHERHIRAHIQLGDGYPLEFRPKK